MPTDEEILNSQAFKVLNLQIDREVEEVIMWMRHLEGRVDRAFSGESAYPPSIDTRIHAEDRNRGAKPLPAAIHDLKELDYALQRILNGQERVRELQSLKLKLMNDHDFTKGDDSLQQLVFGV